MRRRMTLYIGDHPVDMDEQSFILFNYTMEDLSNPTIVSNSFSKQVTLKGTPNNNKVFGDIFRLDRKVRYGNDVTGVDFDPMRKTPFAIYNDMNEILEKGYVKLDEIVRSGASVEYKITLYGGLGSFFYGLMYREDGEKKTLGDLAYKDLQGINTSLAGYFGTKTGYQVIQECWQYLENPAKYVLNLNRGGTEVSWANIVNFAPCYNGLPEDFSADKMVVAPGLYYNILQSKTQDGKTYGRKNGTSSYLVKFGKAHTEWEMKDLRWYLQRPIFSIKALIEAISNPEKNGGYKVVLSQNFFDSANSLYENGWITLPMIPARDRKWNEGLLELIATSTKSPAEYLISFAKIFGLVFLMRDDALYIIPRGEFYGTDEAVIDMTDRVDNSSIKINPVVADTHFYQFGSDPIGEWAKEYKTDYGRAYGIQKVNTGNQFNMETTKLTESIGLTEAVDVQERNLLFASQALFLEEGGNQDIGLTMPLYDEVSVALWSGEESIEESVRYNKDFGKIYPDNAAYPYTDWLPKVQLHDKDNKSVNGEDVLLVFNGVKNVPIHVSANGTTAYASYRLSDDTADMDLLNEGQPCWNFSSANSKQITRIPSFRRSATSLNDFGEEVINATFEWGEPMVRGVRDTIKGDNSTIYEAYWQKYLTDRYDDDTIRMTCKVNLRGLRVRQDLMRRFFFYQGAIFVLNKITNHSLATLDDTECEFIKVQDLTNYRN